VNVDLRDRKVLLTGGAGGLGTAITLAFIEAGARVLALDVDKAKGERLLAECGSLGSTAGSVRLVRGDLSDLGATAELVDELGREEGGIDVLINNAAIYPSRAIEDYSMEELEAVQRVNVQAAIVCVRAVLPAMKQKSAGRIINVASVTLSGGWANLLPYVTSRTRRHDPRLGARARPLRHHRQLCQSGRLSHRRRKDSPGPKGLQSLHS